MSKRKYRMYGLVPYNISPIQQAIQFGHAVDQYSSNQIYKMDGGYTMDDNYLQWIHDDKVYIILDGGTTNNKPIIQTMNDYLGSLNNHSETLRKNEISYATFHEEDLGDQLTAVVFLVDDRVWDTETYPDFDDRYIMDPARQLTNDEYWKERYLKWEENIGGKKNAFLREFLPQFDLA